MIYTISMWTFALFLGAADCELSNSSLSEQANSNSGCSCDGSSCMGNSYSIEANPWRSPYIVFAGDCFYHCRYCLLQWSKQHVGYVDSSWITGPLHSPIAGRHTATTIQILNFSFCAVQFASLWLKAAFILQITHGATMCTLMIVQFVRQSLQMYHVAKQWQLSRYMTLLIRQGILYFFAYVLVSSFLCLLCCYLSLQNYWRS